MQREQYELLATLEDSHWWFLGRRQILCALIDQILPPPASKAALPSSQPAESVEAELEALLKEDA